MLTLVYVLMVLIVVSGGDTDYIILGAGVDYPTRRSMALKLQ